MCFVTIQELLRVVEDSASEVELASLGALTDAMCSLGFKQTRRMVA